MKAYTTHIDAYLYNDKQVMTIRFYYEDCDEDYVAILNGPPEGIQSVIENRIELADRVESIEKVESFVSQSGEMKLLDSFRLELDHVGDGEIRIAFSGDVYFPGLLHLADLKSGFHGVTQLGEVSISADSIEGAQAIWSKFIGSFGGEETRRELKVGRRGTYRATLIEPESS